jgi:predicted sulfurtransferase
MPTSVKQMMEAANASVPRITPAEAKEMIGQANTLVVDVRDGLEVQKSGKVAGALHVPRGMLEFRAIPSLPITIRASTRANLSFFTARPEGVRHLVARF